MMTSNAFTARGWCLARVALAAGGAAALALAAAGCDTGDRAAPNLAAVPQAVAGADAELTVSAPNTVLNQYATLAADVAAGATTLTVQDRTDLDSATLGALAAGDLLLVIQMQGATIATTNDLGYGSVTSLNNAGRYELIEVAGVTGADGVLLSCGLQHDYTAAGAVQVIRVPRYQRLTIAAGGSVVAPAWDGATGGVVALDVAEVLDLGGTIDVSGRGFRGGAVDNQTGTNAVGYRAAQSTAGGEKGESIAGSAATYDALLGRYGRGAPANGGGGGNNHNSGGGGGANGRAGLTWNGQGVMTGTFATDPWRLDPSYLAGASLFKTANTRTSSEGGGRGGYSWSNATLDPLNVGPEDPTWLGDERREVGGLGGHPVDNDPAGRLFLAGGGGAGDGNNDVAGRGGNGGGLVLLRAATVSGTGAVHADGEDGADADANNDSGDAPGGGGGGGTVVIEATSLSGITVTANGGTGGDHLRVSGDVETEGPGGGGGGGFIAVRGGTITTSADGGVAGTTDQPVFVDFPADGATAGNAGQPDATLTALTFCADTEAPDTTITTAPSDPTNDPSADFEFTSDDATATFECSLDGADFAACTATLTTSDLADGEHTLEVRAVDPVGNVDPTPATATWTVDTTAPDTTIATQPSDPTADPSGDFEFTSDDATATFECSLDGAAFIACDATFTTPDLADGEHTLEVRAVDLAGNADPSPASATWTVQQEVVDTTPPDTTIATQPADPSPDPTGDFTFTSDEVGVTFECSLDGGAFTACDATYATPELADGAHTLEVRAVDGAGNLDPTPATYTWTIDSSLSDTTPPDTAIASGPGATTTDPTADFTFTSDDPEAVFECALDGAEFVPCSTPFVTAALPVGEHTLEVRARDLAGNVDATPATATWEVLLDSDGDGLADVEEVDLGTDPNDADTDDDGVMDGQEPSYAQDLDGDGLIGALDVDSDNDGLFDGTELGLGCDGEGTDSAAGHCRPDLDPTTTTDPDDPDTDGGGVRDGSEDANLDGAFDAGETDPTAGAAADDSTVIDTDGDGLSDGLEDTLGSDPQDVDSDDDGLPDGAEPNPSDDFDGDELWDVNDPDSDGDGLFDGTEAGLGCDDPGTDLSREQCIADADDGDTTTLVLDPDTDHGSVLDGTEDSNQDGRVDPGEGDPNDASDDVPTNGAGGAGGAGTGLAGAAGTLAAGGEAGRAGASALPPGGAAGTAGGGGEAGGGGVAGASGAGVTLGGESPGGAAPGGASAGGASGGTPTGGTATGGAPTGGALTDVVVLGGGLCAAAPLRPGSTAVWLGVALAMLARVARRRSDARWSR